MKELIKIAFSALNFRVEKCEKQQENTQKELENIKNSLSLIAKQLEEFVSLSGSKQYKDELEEYKFGE